MRTEDKPLDGWAVEYMPPINGERHLPAEARPRGYIRCVRHERDIKIYLVVRPRRLLEDWCAYCSCHFSGGQAHKVTVVCDTPTATAAMVAAEVWYANSAQGIPGAP